MADLEINSSHIAGDAVAGDKHVHEAPLTTLEQAIERIVSRYGGDDDLLEVIEALNEYITDRPDREVIGLERKLEQGDRLDLLDDAVYQKSKFARKVARHQISLVTQKVYVQVLSNIVTIFEQKIRPLILDGCSKAEVDAAIHDDLIQPVYRAITIFDETTPDEIRGMLYFLTGKCHLVWSK